MFSCILFARVSFTCSFFFFFYRSFICLLVMFIYMVACKLMIPLACMYHIAFMINPRVISKGIPVWFVVAWSCLIHVWSPKGFCVWFLLACYVLVDCERGSGLLNSCIYKGGPLLGGPNIEFPCGSHMVMWCFCFCRWESEYKLFEPVSRVPGLRFLTWSELCCGGFISSTPIPSF